MSILIPIKLHYLELESDRSRIYCGRRNLYFQPKLRSSRVNLCQSNVEIKSNCFIVHAHNTCVCVNPKLAANSALSGNAKYCVLWNLLFNCCNCSELYIVLGLRIFFPLPFTLKPVSSILSAKKIENWLEHLHQVMSEKASHRPCHHHISLSIWFSISQKSERLMTHHRRHRRPKWSNKIINSLNCYYFLICI